MSRPLAALVCCLLSSAVLAQVPDTASAGAASDGPTLQAAPLGSVGPGSILLRGSVDTDILLAYVDLGAAADVSLVSAGPGTIAVGGGIDYGFCGTRCIVASAANPIERGERYFTPHARLTYHFNLRSAPNLEQLDLYGLVMAGMTWASMSIITDDRSAFAASHSLSVMGGLGVGGNYFLDQRFFVGVEGRLRSSQGEYRTQATVGPYTVRDEDRAWSLSGLNAVVFAGLRI